MPKFPPKKTSPARDLLAETISARHEAEAKLAAIHASLARLAEHEAAVARAESDLASLDAAEASETLVWAKDGAGAAPEPNVGRREEINRSLSAARAQAKAATSARAALESESVEAANLLPGIRNWTSAAIAQIVAEESLPLIAAAIDTARRLAAEQAQLKQVFEFVRDIAESLPKGGREAQAALAAMVEFGDSMRLAFEQPGAPLAEIVASGAALREFVASLATDSTVTLAA
jgi:hypothetical protein